MDTSPSSAQLIAIIRMQTEIAKLGLDLGSVMAYVVDQAMNLMATDGAVIELAEGPDMVYRASSGIAAGQLGLRLKRHNSLSGLCVETGETLCCDDALDDPRVDREACLKVGLRSMLVQPLLHDGTAVGVLKLLSQQPRAFNAQHMALLGLISELVAAAMFHAARYAADDLFHRATHDALTGLANRALFLDRLRHSLFQAGREQRPGAVLLLDMDGLKQINDTLGHRAGDAALTELADRIRQSARMTDTAARLGGDEFALLLLPVSGPEGVAASTRRLTELMDRPFIFEGRKLPLRASIGAALFPDDGADLEALLDKADQAMYADKRQHKAQQASPQLVH